MKKAAVSFLAATVLVAFIGSCVSLQDREMTAQERAGANIVGKVEVEFTSFQFFHMPNKNSIKNKAYLELKKEAQKKYEGNIEIANIVISGGGSGWEAVYGIGSFLLPIGIFTIIFEEAGPFIGAPIGIGLNLIGNFQKITATGDVVELGSSRAGAFQANQIDDALEKAAETLIDGMPPNSTIAILSVYSENREMAEYVIDELEYRLVDSRKFQIVDRRRLEQIRREQNFQMSGDVDDNSAIAIGNMLGAGIVITGDISGSGSSRRLVLKALDVKTAQIVTMARERF
jgi:hypothetical protein